MMSKQRKENQKKKKEWVRPAIAVVGFFAILFLAAYLAYRFRVRWLIPVGVIVPFIWAIFFSLDRDRKKRPLSEEAPQAPAPARNADAVVFDLDGTLTDTEKYYQKAWPEAAEHFGYHMEPWMALEVRSLGKPFAEQRFREWFGEDFPYWDVRSYRKELIADMLRKQGITLKPGAEELLQWLKKENIIFALATANNLEWAIKKLEMAGLLKYFDRIICADMVERGKPAPDIYQFACSELKLSPDRVFAVEDSPNGVRSAYEAGCKVIMVPDLSEPDEELETMLYACVKSLEDIPALIERGE